VAEIVGAFGVPHTPFFPFLVQKDGPQSETAQFFAAMTAELETLRPDLIVMASTDHLNTFFFDNLPIFGVGVDRSFKGPNDQPRAVPDYVIPSRPDFAAHLRKLGIAEGFDLALVQEFSVDHSFVVPLHFMTPRMNIPVVPLFVSGHLPPLPSARRCYDFCRLVRKAVESWPEPLRVVVMGSGSFSLDVWGPLIAPGKSDGVPDPDWAANVCGYLDRGEIERLLNEATETKLLGAGNGGQQ
jgi:aromatic ring-opening dioxygenase catalytic subunit (LigB family)